MNFVECPSKLGEMINKMTSPRIQALAAQLQCELWWVDWRDCGAFPAKSDNAAALCELGAWPPVDADISRRVFAVLLYEDAARYDVAAQMYIAAVRADAICVEQASLTRAYNALCRNAHGRGVWDLMCAASSDEEAARQLADALRAGHAAFDVFVASSVSRFSPGR